MSAAKPLPPVTMPLHCWNWTTAEDMVRHALAAFYIACRKAEERPTDGTPWLLDGQPYTDRAGWIETLAEAFLVRVSAEAHQMGAAEYPEAEKQLRKLTAKMTTRDSPRSISGP